MRTSCRYGLEDTVKKKILWFIAAILLCAVIFVWSNQAVIFQRGNPIPYLKAAAQLGDDRPFVKVDVEVPNTDIYISRRGREDSCPALFKYVEDTYGVSFQEQFGSAFAFKNDSSRISVSKEVYWKFYLVWSVPKEAEPIQ